MPDPDAQAPEIARVWAALAELNEALAALPEDVAASGEIHARWRHGHLATPVVVLDLSHPIAPPQGVGYGVERDR